MKRFLLLAALAGIALAMTACGPATPTTTAGTGTGGGAGGGSSEPPAAPTPTPDPDPPAPPEPDKRWDLEADHFGDDDATILRDGYRDAEVFAVNRHRFDQLMERMADGEWRPVFDHLSEAIARQTGKAGAAVSGRALYRPDRGVPRLGDGLLRLRDRPARRRPDDAILRRENPLA